MKERRDSGLEEYMKGKIRGVEGSGRQGFREKGKQERREKDRRVQDRMHAEQKGCRKGSVVISVMSRMFFFIYCVNNSPKS